MWSSGNVRKKTPHLDETIKEDPEENSQPMKFNDKARLYAEKSTKEDDQCIKIADLHAGEVVPIVDIFGNNSSSDFLSASSSN